MTLNGAKIGLRRPDTLAEKQSITRADLQREIGQTAVQVNGAYMRLMRMVYANQFGLTPAEVGAALTPAEAVELRRQAILIKSIINYLLPGTIDDIVPQIDLATAMPANLFPEV